MFGKIKSNARHRREKFIADSGTGIPIVLLEIASKHELKVVDPDRDEPGCNSSVLSQHEDCGTDRFLGQI